MTRILAFCLVGALVVASSAGCGQYPRDPDGTLNRIRSERVLRVGASAARGFVDEADGRVSGPEADLITGFADSLGARVEWVPGGEEELVEDLEEAKVDVVIGGLTDQTPWTNRAGMTRPYAELPGPDGKQRKRVMLVPLGENALLTTLERHLDGAVK